MFIFYFTTAMFLKCEIRRKIIRMCREIHTKVFLAPSLGLAHLSLGLADLLCDEHVFLIMGIVKLKRMPTTMRVHC